MAAPQGNQFWKLRSKHGRDKLFATPELLWEAACEYFKWCDENKWERVETTVKSNGTDIKTIPIERAYTLTGLCLYLNCNSKYFNNFDKQNNDEDFNYIITCIRETIYTQKFEGAAAGVFNSNIIARDLGLTDKKELDHKGGPLVVSVENDKAKDGLKDVIGETDS